MTSQDGRFLGKDVIYWIELQEMLDTKGIPEDLLEEVIKLLEEVIELRGKVSFYESRIKELHKAIEE